MWMMGCNDDGEICLPTNNVSFSSGRKLRPLIPRLPPPPPPNPAANSPDHDNHQSHRHHHGRLNHSHGLGIRDPDRGFFPLNQHHLGTMAEQSKREFHAAHQVVVSSRWNPTPEQLRALEDLYRHGTRTPSADQIQQITSQLRRYGKIEGKNVFYWFQNHKARERQKRRRQMESFGRSDDESGYLNNPRESGNVECKESGGGRKTVSDDDDVQRASNNNINTPTINNKDNVNNSYNWGSAEGSNIDRGGKSAMAAAAAAAVVGGGGGSASGSSSAAAAAVRTTSTPLASSTAVATSLWMKLNESSDLLLLTPNVAIDDDDGEDFVLLSRNVACPRLVRLPSTSTADLMVTTPLPSTPPRPLPCPNQDFQTLQLFPLRREEGGYDEGYDKEMDRVDFAGGCHVGEEDHLRPQFYEFLPMKN
ncbi:hypothetical protein MLD38_024026 [Melastoma candidum]|uniref:Uncharacterized protein n=1 Tax=Melastoma candidum TaxID=119954 RepID=A0ACB9NR32_9MYRT|nr:hypothetical protein MLD38_024026 [Melastoma candidum]